MESNVPSVEDVRAVTTGVTVTVGHGVEVRPRAERTAVTDTHLSVVVRVTPSQGLPHGTINRRKIFRERDFPERKVEIC